MIMAVAHHAAFRSSGHGPVQIEEPTFSVNESILQRVAAGDMAAMQECIDRYGGLVWSLARRLSLSPAEAEDGVQEAFIELWKHAERFDPEVASETTFVSMIARRRLIDRRRSRASKDRLVKTSSEIPEPSVKPSRSCAGAGQRWTSGWLPRRTTRGSGTVRHGVTAWTSTRQS